MELLAKPSSAWIARPNEYERVVSNLIDQRSFGPVAITTSLQGARGMGKTTLAQAVVRDRRVMEAFPDGIYWVTLGDNLSPLELLGRLEWLIFDLTGKQHGLTSITAAEACLRDLIHARKVLLVLDEANNAELVQPFLQYGPVGRVLLITCQDENLPLLYRRTPVDIMVSEEAVTLLSAGLSDRFSDDKPATAPEEAPTARQPAPRPGDPKSATPAEEEIDPLLAGLLFDERGQRGDESGLLADAVAMTWLKQFEYRPRAARFSAAVDEALSDLAGRLNEWPLLLAMVNGLLHGCLQAGGPVGHKSLEDGIKEVEDLLNRTGLEEFWPVTDLAARNKALTAVITACLEPLDEDVRECLFALAVFPQQEKIPLAAVSVLWERDDAQVSATCETLARRALIDYDAEAGSVQLHSSLYAFISEHLRAGVLTDLHERMIEGYAARCREKPDRDNPAGWASGPDDGYFFQHLAGHLAAGGRQADLLMLLFQFRWLSAYLAAALPRVPGRTGVQALLRDYELALSTALDQQSAELRLVQEALSLSAPALARDPGQLATQLLGRLLSFDEPHIQALLAPLDGPGEPWLRPLSVCFAQPGANEVRILRGHSDWVTGLALLPDGQHAVSGSLDGSLRVWDLANGQTTKALNAHPAGIGAMAATPDGNQVVATGWDGWLHIWDLASSQEMLRIKAHAKSIGALAITPDGERIITGADDRLICVWDRVTGEKLLELVGHGDLIRSLAIAPDGRSLVSGSWDATVRIWDLESRRQKFFLTGHAGWVPAVAVSPDGAYALSGGWDRTARIWDLRTGEPAGVIAGFAAPLLSIAGLPGNEEIIAGTSDGSLHLIEFQPGNQLAAGGAPEHNDLAPPALPPHQDLQGHSGGINAIVLTQEGRFAITAADDHTLRIWDLAVTHGLQPKSGHTAPVYALANLAGGEYSLSASWDSTLKLWDLNKGAEVAALRGHTGGVVALAVSADGSRAISGARDHLLKVWELPAGRELFSLAGHEGNISAVSLTSDGLCAVSGADDGTLRVWDLESQACLAEFRGEDGIWACAIAQDGRTIVASDATGRMYFLEIRR